MTFRNVKSKWNRKIWRKDQFIKDLRNEVDDTTEF